MDFLDDDESLAGLTQEPSQKRDCDGNIKLRDPQDLLNSSANATVDFDECAPHFLLDMNLDENSVPAPNDILVAVFNTPPESQGAQQAAREVPGDSNDGSQSLLVSVFFSYSVILVAFLF